MRKLSILACFLACFLASSCVTPGVTDRDVQLRQQLIGTWIVPVDDTDLPATIYYYADGKSRTESDGGKTVCDSTWDVKDGLLYVEGPTNSGCPQGHFRSIDIIEHIDQHDQILKAGDGITLHRVRREPILDQELHDTVQPRFAWPANGSVRVRSRVVKQGKVYGHTHILRWKEKADGLHVSPENVIYHHP